MKELWSQIEKWLSENAPGVLQRMAGPASPEDLAHAEESFGVTLPEDYRQFLQIHNGEDKDDGAWLYGSHSLLTITDTVAQAEQAKQAYAGMSKDDVEGDVEEIQGLPWNPKWVPFAYDGSGGFFMIDLDPSEEGISGQVIQISSAGQYSCVDDNFLDFMRLYLDHLTGGTFEVADGDLEGEGGLYWWLEDV